MTIESEKYDVILDKDPEKRRWSVVLNYDHETLVWTAISQDLPCCTGIGEGHTEAFANLAKAILAHLGITGDLSLEPSDLSFEKPFIYVQEVK
jgi:predicted RNase H-like HicB family nuclease